MLIRTGSIGFAFGLAALAAACGSSTDNGPNDSNTAGTSAAGSNTTAGSTAAGSGTGGAPSSSGGVNAAGTSSSAGQNSAAGHAGTGGSSALGGQSSTGGSNQGTAGAASGGGPASTEGLTFSGSCLDAVHCTDEWDVTFGVDALEQICTAQEGTWSTGHCVTTTWKKKCTQAVFGGVYVQYLPADGICAAGFEEAL